MIARRAWVVALLVAAAALPAGAQAEESFTACVMYERGGECLARTSVLYGSTVYLKGKVSPVPDGRAKLLKKAPGAEEFEVLAVVDIGDKGAMHYAWETALADASGLEPNVLKFKAAGVGCSERVKVLVFAGE